jgi:hypothetical protein
LEYSSGEVLQRYIGALADSFVTHRCTQVILAFTQGVISGDVMKYEQAFMAPLLGTVAIYVSKPSGFCIFFIVFTSTFTLVIHRDAFKSSLPLGASSF